MRSVGGGRRTTRALTLAVLAAILAVSVSAALAPGRAVADRTLDVVVYDVFNAPAGGFDDYWARRAQATLRDQVLFNSFPYLERYTPDPANKPGNVFLMGNYRMAVTGRALPEMSIDAPVVLPHFGKATSAGGFALVSWQMQLVNHSRWNALVAAGYTTVTWDYNDGTGAELSGTVTMDALGAAKVLGLSGDPAAWWAANNASVTDKWSTWLDTEANDRLPIFSGFRLPYGEVFTTLGLTTRGGLIVLSIEHVSWGIDALLARWFYWGAATYLKAPPAGFLAMEGRYDHLGIRANLTATADVDLDTEVDYGLQAWAGNGTAATGGTPVWVWQPTLLDVMPSDPAINPLSELDAYAGRTYVHLTPGSAYYNRALPYEYVPAGWNLKAGETLTFLPPREPWRFFVPPAGGALSAGMRLTWSVPDLSGLWTLATKILVLTGPMSMGGPTPLTYGLPWVEFGVDPATLGGSVDRRHP